MCDASQVSQPKRARAADQVIQVGDVVMARVTRISTRQASVEIICVGETVLREPHRGIVRKEVGEASFLSLHTCCTHSPQGVDGASQRLRHMLGVPCVVPGILQRWRR